MLFSYCLPKPLSIGLDSEIREGLKRKGTSKQQKGIRVVSVSAEIEFAVYLSGKEGCCA